jgi:hypothetical protein
MKKSKEDQVKSTREESQIGVSSSKVPSVAAAAAAVEGGAPTCQRRAFPSSIQTSRPARGGERALQGMDIWSYVNSSRQWTTRTAGHLGRMQRRCGPTAICVALYGRTEWRYQRLSHLVAV